jgi:hypothetical protein
VTWIKTIPLAQADDKLRTAIEEQRKLYPQEYAVPVDSLAEFQTDGPAIVLAHSLMPDVLQHTFSTFGALMNPDLPLDRRQHEMIAATVSSLNSCFY